MMRLCLFLTLTLLGCGEATDRGESNDDRPSFVAGELVVLVNPRDHSQVLQDYGLEIVKTLDEEMLLVRGLNQESTEPLLKQMQGDPRIISAQATTYTEEVRRNQARIQKEKDPLDFRGTRDGPLPAPIVGGDTTSDFEAVGAIVVLDRRGDILASFCSGTLIDDSTVLTAAHCVDTLFEAVVMGWTDFEFVIGTSIHTPSGAWERLAITAALSHPDWDPSEDINDIALLRLEGPSDVATPALLSQDIDPTEWLGQDITYVGWGYADDTNTDTSGIKRTVDVPVVAVEDSVFITHGEDNQNVCYGDSGGAAFLTDETGQRRLAGVNAYIFNLGGGPVACVGPDSAAGATRVDAYLDWIGEYVELAPPIRGDFNRDGVLDSEDIDHFSYMSSSYRGPISDDELERMDLDGSGALDEEDRRIWTEDIIGTRLGDIDLDRDVDTRDITAIITNYWPDASACDVPSTPELCRVWDDGDVDGDGDIDTRDITLAIINFTSAT
jgi:hypothetical protein